ncbi:hypothetical protein [uncultured Enterovirga sp.]|uniref:hypothetical protein n=1 Tax=uncultured Enterovirga sp. TaxID=2026352 RepID=UPI0035C96CC1
MSAAIVIADLPSPPTGIPSDAETSRADKIVSVAQALLPTLARGGAIDARTLRAAMETSFGGSDAEGLWTWKDAYEACEAAQVLFLRRFGRTMRAQARDPAALGAMLARVAALLPTQTRRSEDSQALQQFSTPIGLAHVAAAAAAVTPGDLVLEPSAGTGLLAIFAELAGAHVVLNELADTRADLLGRLFPGVGVTRHDAAQINDHLDAAVRPSIVLMNPPFSALAGVDGTFPAHLRRQAVVRAGEGG